MFNMLRPPKIALALVAATTLLLSVPSSSYAQTGSVRLVIGKAGFIVGIGGGSGTLHFQGRTYPLRISGVSLGTIGIARADLVGRATNIYRPSDIVGTYSAGSAGLAVAAGGKVVQMQNANGVVLSLSGTQAGFEASLSLSGMTISMR